MKWKQLKAAKVNTSSDNQNTVILEAIKCKEVRFASAFFGGFITVRVVTSPERRLAKRISVKWSAIKLYFNITGGIYL